MAEYCSEATVARWAARSRATFSSGVSFGGPGSDEGADFGLGLGRRDEDCCCCGGDEGVDRMPGFEAGWYVNVVACGVVEVKRVKVSDGGRRVMLNAKFFIVKGELMETQASKRERARSTRRHRVSNYCVVQKDRPRGGRWWCKWL
jgi:hypothetical protein